MPHRHSEQKICERRKRALERGFLCPRPPAGQVWVAVPAPLAEPVRTMTKSMATHAEHQEIIQQSHHYARYAALAAHAAGYIDGDALGAALSIHSQANKAKHSIKRKAGTVSANAANRWQVKRTKLELDTLIPPPCPSTPPTMPRPTRSASPPKACTKRRRLRPPLPPPDKLSTPPTPTTTSCASALSLFLQQQEAAAAAAARIAGLCAQIQDIHTVTSHTNFLLNGNPANEQSNEIGGNEKATEGDNQHDHGENDDSDEEISYTEATSAARWWFTKVACENKSDDYWQDVEARLNEWLREYRDELGTGPCRANDMPFWYKEFVKLRD